jgi:2-dehydropantoate 2-reductase
MIVYRYSGRERGLSGMNTNLAGGKMRKDPKIVIYGAGAVGGSVGAWLSGRFDVSLLARGEHAAAMKDRGLETFRMGGGETEAVPVKVIGSIDEAADADIVIIAVKDFSLEEAAMGISRAAGDRPLVVGMQNGLENQRILPKYFSKVIYCVVGYNAWIERPGVIGYQGKGPLILGTPDNGMAEELGALRDMLSPYIRTSVSQEFQDAAHTKLIINLSNSLTTLIGLKFAGIPDSKIGRVGKLFTRLLGEGIRVVKAAGYKEAKLGGPLTWRAISVLARLPDFTVKRLFADYSKSFYASSMTQDIIQRGRKQSELEYLNGYLLELAEKYHINVPVNRAVYELCREAFSQPRFTPMDITEVWERIYGSRRRG